MNRLCMKKYHAQIPNVEVVKFKKLSELQFFMKSAGLAED